MIADMMSSLLLVAAAALPVFGFNPSPISNIHRQHTAPLYSVPNSFDTLTSGLASIARIKHGVSVDSKTVASDGPASKFLPSIKKLYDVENSRECRIVRERITELDLVVDNVIPACPNSRVQASSSSGLITVPLMIVESRNGEERTLEGADAILRFFDNEFNVKDIANESQGGDEDVAGDLLSKADDALAFVPGILRAGRGSTVCGAASTSLDVPRPEKPLVLYSYEGNQFCRLVREVLTELDIVYELRSAGKGSPRREELASITGGSSQCPYLIDPNTGIKMPESKDIVEYLYKTYADFTPPSELLQSVSELVTPLLKPVYKAIAPIQAGSSRENEFEYKSELAEAKAKIFDEIASAPVVIYTYTLSPFCTEATALLDSAGISYKEVSLGKEWIPGLIDDPLNRAALLEITGSSSLPNCFVGGNSVGGLFSGTPGLLASLESGELKPMVENAIKSM
eukprot:scaffold3933_cov155-Skeletonema_menzelii.AAC.1